MIYKLYFRSTITLMPAFIPSGVPMTFFIISVLGILLVFAIRKYWMNKLIADLDSKQAAETRTIQEAIDELGSFAENESVTAFELKKKSEKTFEILQSFNTNGGLNPLIEDTEAWLRDELQKRQS